MLVWKIIIVGILCFLLGYWAYDWFSFVNKTIDEMSKRLQLQYNILIGLKAKVLVLEKAMEVMGVKIDVVPVDGDVKCAKISVDDNSEDKE